MRSLYQQFPVLIFLMVSCLAVRAQTVLKKPDVIQKIDKTSLEVIVDEINKTEILYRKTSDPKGPLYALPKKDVNKIIWNNGDVEEITKISQVAEKPAKPTDLLVKPEKSQMLFGDQKGLFAGIRAGAGLGMVRKPQANILASASKPAFNIGASLGYRTKSFSVQIEALLTRLSYSINVSDSLMRGVQKVGGGQNNLVVPLSATFYTRLNKMKAGLTVGGFGAMQIGAGSTKVTMTESGEANLKNCSECSDKPVFGVFGGITATVIERANHSVFIDARYYHSLADNADYKIAESGVKMNTAMIGVGVLFNLSH